MLTFNPDERISAEKALGDPWLMMFDVQEKEKKVFSFQSPIMSNLLQNIKTIHIEQKL